MMSVRINKFPGRQIQINNRQYLYFGGTAYLGVQTNPEFQALYNGHVHTYGTNYGASRLSNLSIDVYEKAEDHLGHWVGSEACTTLSSGYLAGQLLATHFNENTYQLYYTANTHSSLYLGSYQAYSDFEKLKTALNDFLSSENEKTAVIFLDSIDPNGENYPAYADLKTLPLASCIIVADDSHGIGLIGQDGQGAFRELSQIGARELIVCCSLGKALGLQAGAIFGTRARINSLKETSLFAGASPTSATNMATLLDAMPLYEHQRKLLTANIEHFLKELNHPECFKSIDQYPVFINQNKELAEFLFENGICITHFHYPADNTFQSRIVLTASHTQNDIQTIAARINEFYH